LIGGIRYSEQTFNDVVAQTMSSLMFVATGSLILPAAFQVALPQNKVTDQRILDLSYGTSIVLLLIYIFYLLFQLKTHTYLYEDADDEPVDIGPWAAGATLVVVTICIAICSEYLVDSIDDVVKTSRLSKTFIGLILLPIVGNAGPPFPFIILLILAEHVTAVVMAYKNKMDLAIGVAVGSSLQIALFITPFLVILGWIIHEPMDLSIVLC
jgi:Ca2+:H+ antiporter